MKRLLIAFIVIIIVLFLLPGTVNAFHEGGEGFCEGCHMMHESSGTGGEEDGSGAGEYGYMLAAADAGSVCLRCHAEAGAYYSVLSADGSIFTPGGDFYWLKKSFAGIREGAAYESPGDSHGHNVVAADYGLGPDGTLNAAPGGDYPASAMSCISCHDPHATTVDETLSVNGVVKTANSGNFRLLGGTGYSGGSGSAGVIFTYPAPVAASVPYDWTETDVRHTAYGTGMSEWCANCHADLLNRAGKHPSGGGAKLGPDIALNYNVYVSSGIVSGSRYNAYLSIVPFESGIEEAAVLDPLSTEGPSPGGSANVMCLSCHRAHASAFHSKGRWDFFTTFIADSLPGEGDSGVTGNDVLNSYYGRAMEYEFGRYQRQYCNKCHAAD